MNIERVLGILRRRGPMVLACVLIAAASAFVYSHREKRRYTASASLLFQDNTLPSIAVGLTPQYTPTTQAQQDTNVQLVTLGSGAASQTAHALGPHWTPGMVKALVSASPNSDTSIVTLSAIAATPRLAQTVANTYAAAFVADQQRQAVAQVVAAQRQVTQQYSVMSPAERASAQGVALAERVQSLDSLASLENGNVVFAGQAGLPTSPSSPRIKRDVVLGALLGLLIGLTVAFVLERLDRRIRELSELEAIYNLPLLASVPERADYDVLTSLGHSLDGRPPTLYDEVFNLMRSYLRYFSVDRDLRTLLIISAGPGEGKTTVSYNLAKAAAALGSRILLIEADLRRGTMIGPLLLRADPSLSDVLIGEATMEEAVRSVQIGSRGVLDVLVAGEIPPPNAAELIESHAMEALLDRARASYDLVVIDTSPLAVVADAIPLLTKVDGVIVVSRVGQSRRDAAEHLRDKLNSLRAPVLGMVANGVVGAQSTAYRRGYGYDYRYQAKTPAASADELGVSANGSARGVGVASAGDTD